MSDAHKLDSYTLSVSQSGDAPPEVSLCMRTSDGVHGYDLKDILSTKRWGQRAQFIIEGLHRVLRESIFVTTEPVSDASVARDVCPTIDHGTLPPPYDEWPVLTLVTVTEAVEICKRTYNPDIKLAAGDKGRVVAPPIPPDLHPESWPQNAIHVEFYSGSQSGAKGTVDLAILEKTPVNHER